MKKFYIIQEGTNLHKEYWDHQKSVDECRKAYIAFCDKHGIEAKTYYAFQDHLGIKPTKHDMEKFSEVFLKKVDDIRFSEVFLKKAKVDDIRFFKKKSAINKDWVATLIKNGVKLVYIPLISKHFKIRGRIEYQLFDAGGVVYCAIEAVSIETNVYQEIKASEYYTSLAECFKKAETSNPIVNDWNNQIN